MNPSATVHCNVAGYLEDMANSRPKQAAVVISAGRHRPADRRFTSVSFEELNRRTDACAHALTELGIRPGVRTVLMAPPSVEFFAATFALFKIGAPPILVDPGMGLANLKQCLEESAPTAFLGVPKAHLARVLFGWARRTLKMHVTVGGWFPGVYSLDQCAKKATAPFTTRASAPTDLAAILFTSGSTGIPKGAVYQHGMFAAQIRTLREMYDIRPGEIDLPTFPLFALFAPALGMTSVVPRMDFTRPAAVDPDEIAECLSLMQCTTMFGSPALLDRVGRSLAGVKTFPSLQRVITAGAPVRGEILEVFQRLLLNSASIVTPYGATEALPVATISHTEILSETRKKTDAGAGVCVGRPAPGIEVRIIEISDESLASWSDSLLVDQGVIGEIVVRGEVVSPSYDNRKTQTLAAKIPCEDGSFFHRMGDLGFFDAEGRLWYCGRKSHRVVLKDRVLFTECCEAIFNTHPAVLRSALVGVHTKSAPEPTAVLCVETKRRLGSKEWRLLESELRELGERLPMTKAIQQFLLHPLFPVDVRHNAKIFREKLAVWAAERLA